MTNPPAWTPARDAELIVLARQGKPGSQIGKMLGVSRSAVGGRIHRLNRGLPAHLRIRLVSNDAEHKPPPKPRPAREKRAVPKKPPKIVGQRRVVPSLPLTRKKPPPPPPPPKPLPGAPKLLVDLVERDCRWPVNGGNPFLFCAKPKAADGPYCQRHTAMSSAVAHYRGARA